MCSVGARLERTGMPLFDPFGRFIAERDPRVAYHRRLHELGVMLDQKLTDLDDPEEALNFVSTL